MSLISLNSRNEDPAEFTNILSNNLRLAPNTRVRCLGYGINIKGAVEEEAGAITISKANDTLALMFGDDDDTIDLPPVVVKIPHGTYGSNGADLCTAMSVAANNAVAGGIIPGFCGSTNPGGSGIKFAMNGSQVELTVNQQIASRVEGPEMKQYKVPLFEREAPYGAGMKPLNKQSDAAITVNAASTTIEIPVQASTYTSVYNTDFSWFPHVPTLNAGVPDNTAFNPAVDAHTLWSIGDGAGSSNVEHCFQLCGIVPVTNLSNNIAQQGQKASISSTKGYYTGFLDRGYNPNMDFNGVNGRDMNCFHGFRIIQGDFAKSIKIVVVRGQFNEFGSVTKTTFKAPPTAPTNFTVDIDPSVAWNFSLYWRLVANNVPANSKATGYVSQLWIQTTGFTPLGGGAIGAAGPFLADEYEIDPTHPALKQGGLRSIFKVGTSKGTGVVGDVISCKMAETPPNGTGDITGISPAFDGSVQTNMWLLTDRISYDDVGAGAIMATGKRSRIYNMSQQCCASNVLGYENPSNIRLVYDPLIPSTSADTGITAVVKLQDANDAQDQWDMGQTFLIQMPGLPINGKLGATGDDAQIVGWGRLKSVYNGDTENGAYWYMYPKPPEIKCDNTVELQLNQLNVRLTDEWGQKIEGLDKYTSILLEFSPDPPDASVNPYR